MGILDSLTRFFSTTEEQGAGIQLSALDQLLRQSNGFTSRAGIVVTPEIAMSVPAVAAAVSILAESIAEMPINIYRRDGENKNVDIEHSAYILLHRQPNSFQDAFQFKELMCLHLLLWGNCYAFKHVVRGETKELLPLHPNRVQVEQDENYVVTYKVTLPTGEQAEFPQDAVFHVMDRSFNGYQGVSRIHQLRDSIGLTIQTERHAARLFGNGASPSGVLSTDMPLSKEQMENLREAWKAAHGGDNAYSTAVLDGGFKFQPVTMTNIDAQLIESRKFQIAETSRVYRVPPHLLGDLDRATFSNIEQQSIDFIQRSLSPWLKRWEMAINTQIIRPRERVNVFAEFNVDSQLRGDIKTRYEAFQIGLQNGFLSPNEVRAKENMNPREGGDEFQTAANIFGGDDEEPTEESDPAPEPDELEQSLVKFFESKAKE